MPFKLIENIYVIFNSINIEKIIYMYFILQATII